ncbi:unnamed protein product [Rangifer tarandus platyrhynchus]|uniref:Uncharacterized protein n=1 Tax=Rangifer tarandus platyrhynchus TaxID=3082113 RepID=A0ABN8Y2U0_RANTA|nr:unnamed protein product [Rangifer tarandus platyrhynchus]
MGLLSPRNAGEDAEAKRKGLRPMLRWDAVTAVWYEPDHVKYAVYTSDHNLERKSPHIMDQRLLVADISAPGPQALGLNDPASRGSSRWTVGSRQPGSPRVGQRPPECGLASSCAGGAARPGQVHPRKARQPQGLALQSTRRLSHLSPCWVSGEPPELAVEQLRPT